MSTIGLDAYGLPLAFGSPGRIDCPLADTWYPCLTISARWRELGTPCAMGLPELGRARAALGGKPILTSLTKYA